MTVPSTSLPFDEIAKFAIDKLGIEELASTVKLNESIEYNAPLITKLSTLIENPNNILDLGTSLGSLIIKLQTEWKGANIVGLDASPTSLSVAEKVCPDAHFELHDLNSKEQLPFPNESQDLIVSTETLKYLKEAPAVISKIIDLLKPGGIAGFSIDTHPDDTIEKNGSFDMDYTAEITSTPSYAYPLSNIMQTIFNSGAIILNKGDIIEDKAAQNIIIIQKPLEVEP